MLHRTIEDPRKQTTVRSQDLLSQWYATFAVSRSCAPFCVLMQHANILRNLIILATVVEPRATQNDSESLTKSKLGTPGVGALAAIACYPSALY
eukprot:9501491-Pyramimonas_sp.AAC.1